MLLERKTAFVLSFDRQPHHRDVIGISGYDKDNHFLGGFFGANEAKQGKTSLSEFVHNGMVLIRVPSS